VNEYFSMLKETGAYAGRSWGAACSAWARAAGNWAAEDITAVLEMLLDADAALKESRVSSEEQVIVGLALAICSAGEASAAA
jgi:DNA polymerase-3 subunit delta